LNIFLSTPFSSRVGTNGTVESAYRRTIENLLADLREHGHQVYSALEYSEWKMGGTTPPVEEFKQDFDEIDAADKLIVLLEERVSAGVQLECGYAYARHKVIEMYQLGKAEWSNKTFAEVNGNDIISVQNIDDFADQAIQRN
jgi:nucleoside 2-deoxyribosyltransferase